VTAAAVLTAAGGLGGAGAAAGTGRGPVAAVAVGEGSCPAPAIGSQAGPVTIRVTDAARMYASVYVVDRRNLVYAEIPWLAPGRTLSVSTTLAAGDYALRCVLSDDTAHTSAYRTLRGSAPGAVAGYRPLPDLDLAGPVKAYRAWISARLPVLAAAARALDADAARGDLAAARTDWLTARLDYARLGAAYNAFGDFDDAIDGSPQGRPGGTADPGWTGLQAIEYALWHHASPARLRALTHRLAADTAELVKDFPSEDTDPGDLPLRAHEILEDTLEDQLTGEADEGSGDSLAIAWADAQGTAELLDVLAPVLTPRDPALLTRARGQLAGFEADLLACRTAGGGWAPVARLDRARRERLDSDAGALLETLSHLPDLLASRTGA